MSGIRGDRQNKGRDAERGGSLGERVLSHAQAGREIVQDFVPLADSLEWELGGAYLRLRGNKAFLSDAAPVPFIVNNDGALSRNAADVFFASLVAAEKAGRGEEGERGEPIFVLELGIGVGLFARYFLDCMRDLCREHKKDYYDRLCYIAADRSERMLQDVLRHGVLAEHPGRYRVRQLDAMRPEELFGVGQDFHPAGTGGTLENVPHGGGRLRGVSQLFARLLAGGGAGVRRRRGETTLRADLRGAERAAGGLHGLDAAAIARAGEVGRFAGARGTA